MLYTLVQFSDNRKPIEITEYLESRGCAYRLGAKAAPLGIDLDEIDALDCSGFHRLCLFHSLGRPVDFDLPDGSAEQHAYYREKRFKPVEAQSDGHLRDGIWRAWILAPEDTEERIGHILLTFNNLTYESYGGHGPGSREWGSEAFMARMHGYVLTKGSK